MKQIKVVFTNGIFDILHVGHIELLKYAKSLGDRLVVGINSDSSTKLLKGKGRPIIKQGDRKKILESIRYVDKVIIFNDVDTVSLMKKVRPDIIVKGGEWTAEEVKKRDKIPEDVEVKICPLVKDYSTTNTIKKIKEAETWKKKGMNK